MTKYIALLRGVNVGGQKKILMKDLRSVLETQGFQDVETYIQSGNVVFSSDSEKDLDVKISEAIKTEYGFDVSVLVITNTVLENILKACPFSEEKKKDSYFVLLRSEPHTTEIEIVNSLKESYPNEEFVITSNCVFIHYILGAGKAKLGNNWFEKKLKVGATSRNYRTMMKLQEMVGASN